MRCCELGSCHKAAEWREKKTIFATNHNNAYCSACKEVVKSNEGTTDEDFVAIGMQLVLAKAA